MTTSTGTHHQHHPTISVSPSLETVNHQHVPSNYQMSSSISTSSDLQLMNTTSGVAFGETLVNRKTTIGKAIKRRKLKEETFESVDFYSNFPVQEEEEEDRETIEKKKKTRWGRFVHLISKYTTRSTPFVSSVFLALLAVCCALMNITLDFLITKVETTRKNIYTATPLFPVNYAIYVVFSVLFSFLAAGCVHYISPDSPGSGVPEMKSILAGNMMERYLTAKTAVAKYLGIMSGIGAGFPAARYGPSVHISACMANTLLKLPLFKRLNKNEFEKNSMLQAACAAGVSGALGSPFGGVIFTIEVTSNYFKVENLWRAIFCSLVGSLFFYTWRLTGWLGNEEPTLYSTKFKPLPYRPREYIMFLLIGVVSGLVGALFVAVFHRLVRLRQQFTLVRASRYILVACVSCICAILAFSMNPLLYGSSGSVLQKLFGMDKLDETNMFLRLCVTILGRFLSTAIIAVLPVTSGVFGPSMLTGAAMGRLIGEVARIFWPDVVPGGYAVVGATALAAGVTRTLSPIVVMFEITGQLSFMVPMMISSVIAVGIGNLFNASFYDTVVYLRGLPYLRSIRQSSSYKLLAKDVMREKLDYVIVTMSPEEIRNIIYKSKHFILPVVEDSESMNFLGSATRDDLLSYAENIYADKTKPFPVDEGAFSISATTALAKIHFLISMVGLSHAWVLSRRRLVGVVVKKDLIKLQL